MQHHGGGPRIIPITGVILQVAATCSPAEAKAYLDNAPANSNRIPIGPKFDPNVSDSDPTWYTPDQATTGWYLYSSNPATPGTPQGNWCEMTYDDQTGRLYIMVYRY